MHYARRLCNPNCQGFYVSDSLIKGTVRFGVSHCLIKQIREVVKQCVLILNVQGQYAVKKSRHIVKIVFPHFFGPVAVSNEQTYVAQRLTWVSESRYIAAFNNSPQHQA